MCEEVKFDKELKENMKEKEEIELLLGEITHVYSHVYSIRNPPNHHHHLHGHGDHGSNVLNGSMMMSSNGNGNGMYGNDPFNYPGYTCESPVNGSSSSLFSNGSPSTPPLEEVRPYLLRVNSNNFNGSLMDSKAPGSSIGKSLTDEVNLSREFSKMYINGDQKDDLPLGVNLSHPCDPPVNYRNGLNDYGGSESPISRGLQNGNGVMGYCFGLGNLSGSEGLFRPYPGMNSQFHNPKGSVGWGYPLGGPFVNDIDKVGGAFCPPIMPHLNGGFPNVRVPQREAEFFTREIINGGGVNNAMNKGYKRPKGQNIKSMNMNRHQEKRTQLDNGFQENGRKVQVPAKYSSLAEAQGYIYYIAKDQHGCRFLQRMFDEGTSRDVQIIFNEIINHVVELMMNPFGNYLMQKLLTVCNEEQRMEILLKVTQQPGELVNISLNTHGTRVVQKLIETLKTRHQICLVISALEPGFLALIKDLNGNHVVQRCLQCLNHEDNKFIFVAAAKYCVDIATHQHGCCVLQQCILHSTGEYRETLLAEIRANALLIAQDPFGNYVIQFIIMDLKIPSVAYKLLSKFEGSYAHLSMQKFSSHVVEKCLLFTNDQIRSKIIMELLSTNFEQLLQDPHANYVIQTALRVAEGPIRKLLVDTIESHRAGSRNCPYSKCVFSHKVLKK